MGWFGKKQEKKTKSASKRERFSFDSRAKDILTTLFELPVRPEWLTDEKVDKINRDAIVISSTASRKAHVQKKEVLIQCENKDIVDNLTNCFSYDIIENILDIPYHGFGVYEINWERKDDFRDYPELIERDYRNFILDKRVLYWAPNGVQEPIAPFKSIHAVYKAKHNKPYGQGMLNSLFWLIEFKNGSLEFWLKLLEKFGTPWVIAKTDGDKNALADEIYNMLGGDGAVLDPDDELDIVHAENKGDFEKIVDYIDDQIRTLILGGNLTSQVKGGSQAAATVHNDIREDIAMSDEKIVVKVIKQAIAFFKKVNAYTGEITFMLKDKDDPNIELSTRDKTIYEMGYQPTQEYIEKTYNIAVTPIPKTPMPNSKKMTFSKELYEDELDRGIGELDIKLPKEFISQVADLIEGSNSFEEMQEKLYEAYPNMKLEEIEGALFDALGNGMVQARAEIEDETKDD